jgi:hypothetical protein
VLTTNLEEAVGANDQEIIKFGLFGSSGIMEVPAEPFYPENVAMNHDSSRAWREDVEFSRSL